MAKEFNKEFTTEERSLLQDFAASDAQKPVQKSVQWLLTSFKSRVLDYDLEGGTAEQLARYRAQYDGAKKLAVEFSRFLAELKQ